MIKKPVAVKVSLTKCAIILGFCFICAVLAVTPQIFYLKYSSELGLCWLIPPSLIVGFRYLLAFEIIKMIVPMLTLAIIYMLAALELAAHQRKFMEMCTRSTENSNRVRQDRKIVTMFVIILTIFFLLNAPYSCLTIAQSYIVTFDRDSWNPYVGSTAHIILFALSSVSSIINPLVYSKMHIEVADSLKICQRRMKKFPKSTRNAMPSDRRVAFMRSGTLDNSTNAQNHHYIESSAL